MANRRMFSASVVETDAFLGLPVGAQCLYFHLGLAADDDGFVSSPKRLTATCGCSRDDLQALVAAGYIIPFKSGVCAVAHWTMNNFIRRDRYTPTIYTAEKAQMTAWLSRRQPDGCHDDNQTGDNLAPQYSVVEESIAIYAPAVQQEQEKTDKNFAVFWSAYPRKKGKQDARKAFEKALAVVDLDAMLNALERQKKTENWTKDRVQFIPYPATWLNGHRWEDVPDEPAAPGYQPLPENIPEPVW